MKPNHYFALLSHKLPLIPFNLKDDNTKATLIHMYIEVVISRPTTTSEGVWKR